MQHNAPPIILIHCCPSQSVIH